MRLPWLHDDRNRPTGEVRQVQLQVLSVPEVAISGNSGSATWSMVLRWSASSWTNCVGWPSTLSSVWALDGEAQQTYETTLKLLIARRAHASAELERIAGRLGFLLEHAEARLVTRQECAARRAGSPASQEVDAG
jgi:hypothetical protein